MGSVINFVRGSLFGQRKDELTSELANELRKALQNAVSTDARIVVIQSITVNYCSGGGARLTINDHRPVYPPT